MIFQLRSWRLCAVVALMALSALAVRAEEKLLCDFESDQDLSFFELKTGKLSDQHVTHGQKSLKILPGEYMVSYKLPQDWSAYDALEIDAFVDGDAPVNGTTLIGDKPWQDHGRTYWDRHNGTFNLKPGANVLSIPVNGLFRGEAGSRGNGLKNNIDPKQILRLDLGFNTVGKVDGIYLDHLRFSKETRPDGILAFDFGPESQTVFPGFTPITWNTVYGQNGGKSGFKTVCGAPNRARDDTFPTRLFQDFVWFEENGNEFITDVPNGKYHVWMVFDDCGYWGGENCRHHKRTVSANGKQVFVDDRGVDGPNDYLYRFEKIEPKPGDSLWDLYVKDLFKPARFEADVADGKLRIQCAADAAWSTKVAAIIVYPDTNKAAAEKWVGEVEERNKKEFESRAVFMGPKTKALDIPADAQSKGYWLGVPSLDDTVTFVDAPGKTDGKLQRAAARGQRLGFTFAVRPLKDFSGEVKLTATELSGPGGKIPASNVDLRYVHHLTQRGFNDIAYTIAPMSLRHLDGSVLKLSKDLTRQFWITLDIPEDAKPGAYRGEVALTAGELSLKLPIVADVLDLTLDDPDYNIGFLGSWIPAGKSNGWYDLGKLMKQYGMNSFCGGPNIPFEGFDENGKPKLDFAACDEFFKELRKAGYTHPVYSYGSPAMVEGLQDGYSIGETVHGWEKKTGKPFSEILKIVWGAVKEHSEKENWLPVYYGLLDEPRVVEGAQENLAFHKAYHDAVPFVKTGGFYSVNWKDHGPLETAIQDIFKTMYWSGVNGHTQDDLDSAKKFGRELHVYNQGLDRFTFGAYSWAEMHKGVKGLMQWHTLALSGYQWFDLDAREPDPAVINWGKKEVIPTLYTVRTCEGAFDLRIATTLWNMAEKKKGGPEAKAAQDFLEDVNKQIEVGKSTPPKGFMDGETFRNTCFDHIKKLQGK
jgi:hypothetical protein